MSCELILQRSPLGLGGGEPLAETLLHGLPAVPAAHVDRGDDLARLEPLDEALQLQKAAVLAVWDSCAETQTIIYFLDSVGNFNRWHLPHIDLKKMWLINYRHNKRVSNFTVSKKMTSEKKKVSYTLK